jgi:hypothetical protein
VSVYVYLGPTLPVAEAREILDAVYLPPVRQGDVYRLTRLRRPTLIGLVDGHFNQVPAVWHKELLWAMSRGVHLFGAASMGALRAAELAAFGMRGVGRVFEAYRDGVLPPFGGEAFEDDDEVAVVHAPGDAGYLPLSEAMVNIRCTLAAAAEGGIISRSTRDHLVRLAKQTFYPRRNFRGLLQQANEAGVATTQLEALQQWLPQGRCDQKRDDARRLLQAMRAFLDDEPAPMQPGFGFQHTAQWEQATAAASLVTSPRIAVLDELRLEGEPYYRARRAALAHLLALPPGEAESSPLAALQRELGLPSGEALDEALNAAHGCPERVEALWQTALAVRELQAAVGGLPAPLLERQLMALLKGSDALPRLEARAGNKLERLGPQRASADELSGLETLQLQDWYFSRRLGREIPSNLEDYVLSLGFSDVAAFNDVLLAEYVYLEGLEDAMGGILSG